MQTQPTIAEITDVVLDAHLTDSIEARDAIVISTFNAHDVLIFAYKPGQQVWGDPFDPAISPTRRSQIVRGLNVGCGHADPLWQAFRKVANHVGDRDLGPARLDVSRALAALL